MYFKAKGFANISIEFNRIVHGCGLKQRGHQESCTDAGAGGK
jgi:hypothetical protein